MLNNDFNQSKQDINCTKDTVVTYLYIQNPQKLSTASKNLFFKSKEDLVLRLGRGTRRNEHGDKILYVRSMRVSNPCNVNNPCDSSEGHTVR